MTTCLALLAAGEGARYDGPEHKLRAMLGDRTVLEWAFDAMVAAPADEHLLIVGDDAFDDVLGSRSDATVVANEHWRSGQASSVAAAVRYADAAGHDQLVIGIADQPFVGVRPWIAVASDRTSEIAVASFEGAWRPPVRLHRSVWSELPAGGDDGARVLLRNRPELVTPVVVTGCPDDIDTVDDLERLRALLDADTGVVESLLGRAPQGRFEVVVRSPRGEPVVLLNAPVLDDGRPMPTLHWLCGAHENVLIGRLESLGGVRRAERELGLDRIDAAHRAYESWRDALVDVLDPRPTHRPSGGVGGTRTGVKCLHAHYAWWLAGGPDPVGAWVFDHLDEVDHPNWPGPREDVPRSQANDERGTT